MNPSLEMLEMSNSSLRIKCTIPEMTEEKMRELYALFFKATQEHDRTNMTSMSAPILVKEAYEFVVEVLPFAQKRDLFDLMHIFYTLAKDKISQPQYATHMMPVALVSSPDFFSNFCTPAHTSVPIQSLYFGNIMNSGALGVHWTVEFYKPKAKYNQRDREQEIMFTSFEHDRGSVTVRFKFKEQKDHQIQNVEFAVKFYYNAIRRIIVDPISRDDDRRGKKFRFHFDLNCPPEVRSFIDHGNDKMRYGDGKRMIYLSRGWGKDGRESSGPHALAVPDSSVVCLEFSDDMQEDRGVRELFEILSRLRVRSSIPIEFASLDLLNLHYGYYARHFPYVKDAIDPKNAAYMDRIKWATPEASPNKKPKKDDHLNKVGAVEFKLRYVIEALLSRGAKVKDQLLLNAETWASFLDFVCGQYKQNADKTLVVMENVINRIDEMSFPMTSIFRVMLEEVKAYDELKMLNDA
ncbi:hypothetical protein PMAYCL1PPCAC_31721 [Pristionchus mayeri]|uniref:PH-like domain-containing protein n=1 Tax=Pristionchus mayeri TaxID=1317129 RepID=A0AAN5DEH9_9BILA|nr:hypothetical protein PMAYCL1PPCAC_31721 [Pristionchus mayeri]